MPTASTGVTAAVNVTRVPTRTGDGGDVRSTVKSHHHQGVDRLGQRLVVTGHSEEDGLIEAIEMPGRRFVLGVLWHPEEDERSRVVGALVEAARSHALREAA